MSALEKRLEKASVEVQDKVSHVPQRPVEHLRRRVRARQVAAAAIGTFVVVAALVGGSVLVADRGGIEVASTAAPSVTASSMPGEVLPLQAESLPRLVLELPGWVHSRTTEDIGNGAGTGVPGTTIEYYLPTENGLYTDIAATLDLRGIPAGSHYEETLPFWGNVDYEAIVVRGRDARLFAVNDGPTSNYTIIWRESDSVVGWVDVSGVSRGVTRVEALSLAASIVSVTEAEWSDLLQEENLPPRGMTTTTLRSG